MSFRVDMNWSVNTIQPLAERLIYNQVWPEVEVIPLDDDNKNRLKVVLDIAGADKILRWPDGGIAFLAQRFRRFEKSRWDDFTMRRLRPSGRLTEVGKIRAALERSGLIAAFYAYGHVNKTEDDFLRFRILRFTEFCQAWEKGTLLPAQTKANTDGSSWFFCWPFKNIPDSLFLYDSEPKQLNLFNPSSETNNAITPNDRSCLLALGEHSATQ